MIQQSAISPTVTGGTRDPEDSVTELQSTETV
jgi:hypothetical protein